MGAPVALRLRVPARRHPSASISPPGTFGSGANRFQGDYRIAFSLVIE